MNSKTNFVDDLIALARASERDIDTSEISEQLDFSSSVKAKFYDIQHRDYDVRSIANWCLNQAARDDIVPTNMWLNKIVFAIYEYALREFRILLTPAKAEAWNHGPVFREIYSQFDENDPSRLLKRFNAKKRTKEDAPQTFVLSDVHMFEDVWKRYGRLTSAQLRRISHQRGAPWEIVWELGGKHNPGMEIDIATILGRTAGQHNGKQ